MIIIIFKTVDKFLRILIKTHNIHYYFIVFDHMKKKPSNPDVGRPCILIVGYYKSSVYN